MQLTNVQMLVTILAIALGAMLTRFLPFVMFPENKKTPRIVLYLGNVLPPAMMGLLVIYCLKNVSITSARHGIPELIAISTIAVLHKWKNNVLLSISCGTIVYMVLVQSVFS